MNWNQLAAAIADLTPAQRTRPAVVAMQQSGEVAEVTKLLSVEDFNGTKLPNQMVLWYDNRAEPEIF